VRQYRYRDEELAGLTNSALAEPRQEVCPDWLLTDLPVRVQAVPAEAIASMLVLQDAAGPLRRRGDESVALRLASEGGVRSADRPRWGLYPTTLTVWRHRLRASALPGAKLRASPGRH
jgi:hypothetical protein